MATTTAVYSHFNLRASVKVHLEKRHPEMNRTAGGKEKATFSRNTALEVGRMSL